MSSENRRAALVSNFPVPLVKRTVRKLAAQGVTTVRCISGKESGQYQLTEEVDLLLVMHELMSHNQFRELQLLARRLGVPLICLSRKASAWPRFANHTIENFLHAETNPPL